MSAPDPAMHEYYERGEEAARLDSAVGRLELERTQEILLRALPPAPATVADVGGGPGRYAIWLADLGYTVLHRDIVPLHIQLVTAAAQQVTAAAAIESRLADARALDLPDASADAVLLLGPLYHLEAEADRIAALREAARVVRPGGPVFGAAISRWAPRLDGILRHRLDQQYPQMGDLVAEVESTGVLPPLQAGSFCGYTHRPDELRAEVAASGLEVTDLVCVEGGAFLLGDVAERMSDPAGWQVVLETSRALERVPELMGNGPHLLVTARRPGP
ncbi:MAG TPA: class I SAM-dependent methyltransferase [Streptosporangiaceae bacterium]|jgi:SAM-dependent methyltransferase